jgi:hypothetical protein
MVEYPIYQGGRSLSASPSYFQAGQRLIREAHPGSQATPTNLQGLMSSGPARAATTPGARRRSDRAVARRRHAIRPASAELLSE